MKKLTSATLLLLASTLATAAESEKATDASLVLAYSGNTNTVSQPDVETASQASADRALERTLGLVSANLSFELDERIAEEMPTVAK